MKTSNGIHFTKKCTLNNPRENQLQKNNLKLFQLHKKEMKMEKEIKDNKKF